MKCVLLRIHRHLPDKYQKKSLFLQLPFDPARIEANLEN